MTNNFESFQDGIMRVYDDLNRLSRYIMDDEYDETFRAIDNASNAIDHVRVTHVFEYHKDTAGLRSISLH